MKLRPTPIDPSDAAAVELLPRDGMTTGRGRKPRPSVTLRVYRGRGRGVERFTANHQDRTVAANLQLLCSSPRFTDSTDQFP